MRKFVPSLIAFALFATMISGSVLAGSRSNFTIGKARQLNGQQLRAGSYQLRLSDGGAVQIYRRGKLIMELTAQVRPLHKGTRKNSVVVRNNVIVEIRTKNDVLSFREADLADGGQR